MNQPIDPSSKQEPAQHHFLQHDNTKPLKSEANRIPAYLLNRYSDNKLSVNQYRKAGKLSISNKTNLEAWQVRFDDIVSHIIETRSFDPKVFNFTEAFAFTQIHTGN